MSNETQRDSLAFIIGGVIVAITAISCTTFYKYNELNAMKSNIESAIVKGIDPVAVKCAYRSGEVMCAVYASSRK